MMNLYNIARNLPSGTVNKDIIYLTAVKENDEFRMSSIFWLIKKMIDEGLLIKVGRNKYCAVVTKSARKRYRYSFSERVQDIVTSLKVNFPLMEFQAWEAPV